MKAEGLGVLANPKYNHNGVSFAETTLPSLEYYLCSIQRNVACENMVLVVNLGGCSYVSNKVEGKFFQCH